MSKERTVKIDPFFQFLLDYRGFATPYQAAKELGLSPQNMNTYATRGLRSIPAMSKLAEDFGVPIEEVGTWISKNIHILIRPGSENELIEIAS